MLSRMITDAAALGFGEAGFVQHGGDLGIARLGAGFSQVLWAT